MDVAVDIVVGIAGALWSKIRGESPRGSLPDRPRSTSVAAARVRAAQLQRWAIERGLALQDDHRASGVLAGLRVHIEWEVLPDGLNHFQLQVSCKLPLTKSVRIDRRSVDAVERTPIIAACCRLFDLPGLGDLVRSVELDPISLAVRCFDVPDPELTEALFEESVQIIRMTREGGSAYRDR